MGMGKWFLVAAIVILSLSLSNLASAEGTCETSLGQNCENTFECSCSSSQLCLPQRNGSDAKGCYAPVCGDGFLDRYENQQTCCKDAGCPAGRVCDPASNQCVECSQDSDCRGLLCFQNRCVECVTSKDCSGVTIWKNTGSCSQNPAYFIEDGEQLGGLCKEFQCIGKVPVTRDVKCENTFCQADTCGCVPGFEACAALNSCVIKGNLKINEPCGCDFQCASGLCAKGGTCLEPLTVSFSSDSRRLSTKESATIMLSADNKLNQKISVNILIDVGTGGYLTGVISGADCTGNQCKISKVISERGREEVAVEIGAKESTAVKVQAFVSYEVEGKQYMLNVVPSGNVEFIKCGNDRCETGETSSTCCRDCGCPLPRGYFVYSCSDEMCTEKADSQKVIQHSSMFLLLALILAAIILIIRAKNYYRYKTQEEEKESSEKMLEDQKQRVLIRKAIIEYGKKKDIVASNAREAYNAIRNKFDFEFTREAFNEEFLSLCASRSNEQQAKAAAARFCTKCGTAIKTGAGFCTKCGQKVRMIPSS